MNLKYSQLYDLAHINYLVMFMEKEVSSFGQYEPVLKLRKDDIVDSYDQGGCHLFDPDLIGILPALRYALHLPRIGFDAVDINANTAINSYDSPHDILIFPSSFAKMLSSFERPGQSLLIYEDKCEAYAQYFAKHNFIDILPISQLSSEKLKEHWKKIGLIMKPVEDEECIPDNLVLLHGDKILAVPPLFLLNHVVRSHLIFELEADDMNLLKEVARISFNVHCDIKMFYEISKNPSEDINIIRKKVIMETKLPVVVTMLGRPVYQKRLAGAIPDITQTEREVCRIMAVHRACAKDGIVIELKDTPRELYLLLDKLEQHCKSPRISNIFVWATLNKMGEIFSNHIDKEQGMRIVSAEHITAFTDFPIGLSVMPSGSAPLCCYSKISYRPITPLTRALQYECVKVPQHYIGKRCKIVIAECIEKTDRIRKYCEGAWRVVEESSKNQDGLTVILRDVNSVAELKRLLLENEDTDILLISAHGVYEKESNIAGLSIGKDIWLGVDNDLKMPPLVMLSACHVSPRGSGSVNVADLLLRAGAKAVLGTFIPVDVRRNALLITRFFSYIHEALSGNKTYYSVLDAWTGVVASNAVNEIIYSSRRLQRWAFTRNRKGIAPIRDFMINKSAGRLHGTKIYEETIQILREMTTEDGLGEYFESVLKSQGFFPESLFYQMIGFPENILLYHPIHYKFAEKLEADQ